MGDIRCPKESEHHDNKVLNKLRTVFVLLYELSSGNIAPTISITQLEKVSKNLTMADTVRHVFSRLGEDPTLIVSAPRNAHHTILLLITCLRTLLVTLLNCQTTNVKACYRRLPQFRRRSTESLSRSAKEPQSWMRTARSPKRATPTRRTRLRSTLLVRDPHNSIMVAIKGNT